MTAQPLVLDTHFVLDIWLFNDPRTAALRQTVESGERVWLATQAMYIELERVLGYPRLVQQLASRAMQKESVLAAFERHAAVHEAAPAAPALLRCTDPDDQMFIDLAWAHSAELLSRDQAVLAVLKKWHRQSCFRG